MKNFLLTLLVFLLFFSHVAYSQGNSISSAITAGKFGECGGNSFRDNRNLLQSSLGNTYGNSSNEVYYKFNVSSSTQINIETCSSTFSTKLYLLDSGGTLLASSTPLNCNNGQIPTGSLVSNLSSGVYYVIIEELNGGSLGNLNLKITSEPTGPAPIGDAVSTAIDIGILSQSMPFTHIVNLSSANCYRDNNGLNGPDIYYKFTLDEAALVTIANCGSQVPTKFFWINEDEDENDSGVIDGPVCPGQAVSLSMVMEAGTHYIRVEVLDNIMQGEVKTSISIGPLPVDPSDPGINCTTSTNDIDCLPINANISSNQNYILTTTLRRPGFHSEFQLQNRKIGDLSQYIQYFDGLGRPLQDIHLKGSSDATKDIVRPYEYDIYGRESKKYLPYAAASTADGSYKNNALSAGQGVFNFYNPIGSYGSQLPGGIAKNAYPFSETIFEAGPLSRPIEQGSPGAAWQTGSGHTIRTSYGTNAANEVRYWTINATGATGGGYYSANQLYKTTIKDENWKEGDGKAGSIEEFKTKKGHLVLKRVWETASKSLSTYYIYDEYSNLRYVLPPAINENGQNLAAFTESDDLFKAFIYAYHHDDLSRMTEKKIPGKGWEYFVYNKLDQLVFTQDAEQRKRNLWMVNRYDGLGRQIITATWNNNNIAIAPTALKDLLDTYPLWDEKNNSHAHGYQLKSYPTILDTVLKVDYYDNYNIVGLPQEYNKLNQHAASTIGLATASKILVINGGTDMLWQVNYYDDKGRLVRNLAQHYKGGQLLIGNYDEIINSYSYTDELLKATRIHKVAGVQQIKLENRQVYDHTGKVLKVWQKINDGDSILMVQNEYNDVGQLISKKLHGTATSTNQLAPDHVLLNAGNVVAANQQLQTKAAKSITLTDGFHVDYTGNFSASIVPSSFVQTIAYSYNERGWLKQLNDPANVNNAESFGMRLLYEDHPETAKRQFNGNISSINWQSKVPVGVPGLMQAQQTFDYQYDGLNRLSLADYKTTGKVGYFNEALGYDLMGNIVTLNRKANNTLIDQLNYTYANNNQSNQLAVINDQSGNAEGLANGITNYTYNDNGNLLSDDRKALQFHYNILNLPKLVKRVTDNQTIQYIYDATGRKLRKLVAGSNRDYVDGIEYGHNGDIDFFLTQEGRVVKNGNTYSYEYFLKDHLGNTRVMVKQDGSILQVQDYYAFGLEMNPGNQYTGSPANKYLYNGKEKQQELGLEQLDYGARFYDPVIARWNAVDPLAEMSKRFSAYVYGNNNPMRFVDPDGMAVEEINGGYRFTEDDAIFAFGILKNRQQNQGQTGSVGIITFGKEKVWGQAMKALIPEAITENVSAEKGRGGYDDFYGAIKSISDKSVNGIGFLAVFSHGGFDHDQSRSTYGEGMIFANADLHPNASNVYTSDLVRLGEAVQSGKISFAEYAVIYLGACNGSTATVSSAFPGGRSFAMELARVSGAFVWGANNSHMNAANPSNNSNTVFGATDKGGQLIINYWYPGSSTGSSIPAKSRSVNVASWARWYLNLGY